MYCIPKGAEHHNICRKMFVAENTGAAHRNICRKMVVQRIQVRSTGIFVEKCLSQRIQVQRTGIFKFNYNKSSILILIMIRAKKETVYKCNKRTNLPFSLTVGVGVFSISWFPLLILSFFVLSRYTGI